MFLIWNCCCKGLVRFDKNNCLVELRNDWKRSKQGCVKETGKKQSLMLKYEALLLNPSIPIPPSLWLTVLPPLLPTDESHNSYAIGLSHLKWNKHHFWGFAEMTDPIVFLGRTVSICMESSKMLPLDSDGVAAPKEAVHVSQGLLH